MNKIKIIALIALVSFVLPLRAQQKGPKAVQENIDNIFDLYGKMQSKIKSWSKSQIKIEEDSVNLFTKEYLYPLIKDIDSAGKYASPTQNVLVQFYALQTYTTVTRFLRSNGNNAIAMELNQSYRELLAFRAEVNGVALSNGVLRNVSMEKIDIAQYKYLNNLYALAIEVKDQELLLYTSKEMLNNKRAGLYDQSISALYLFDVSYARKNYETAFVYGESFFNKFTNLSFENRKLIQKRAILDNQIFVKNFYNSGVQVFETKKELLNAQNVSKYAVIGEKYEIPNLSLYMQALLTRLGQIDEKGKIEDLYNQSKEIEDKTLSAYFELKLSQLKK